MGGEREKVEKDTETGKREPKASAEALADRRWEDGQVTSERKGGERRETGARAGCRPRVLLTPGGRRPVLGGWAEGPPPGSLALLLQLRLPSSVTAGT